MVTKIQIRWCRTYKNFTFFPNAKMNILAGRIEQPDVSKLEYWLPCFIVRRSGLRGDETTWHKLYAALALSYIANNYAKTSRIHHA